MANQNVRIGVLTDDELELINVLTVAERKTLLLAAAEQKMQRLLRNIVLGPQGVETEAREEHTA